MEPVKNGAMTGELARRLDSGSSLFLFGYCLRALEGAAAEGRRSGEGYREAGRILDRLRETASLSEGLEPFSREIDDVARLLGERTKCGGRLEEGLASLLEGCAKRWFQRVREMPKRRNSLAVDIAFNLELAGQDEIAAGLYEAILCMEAGAFHASRLMSGRALDSALGKAGAAGGDLPARLAKAREAGLITAADARPALACFGGAGRPGDGGEPDDGSSADWALETALRLTKKLLKAELDAGLRRTMASKPGAKGSD
jgi:hypothetical protein